MRSAAAAKTCRLWPGNEIQIMDKDARGAWKTRRQRRTVRITTHWQDKIRSVAGERERALVRWDWLRTEISRLPGERREAAWSSISVALDRCRRQIAGR